MESSKIYQVALSLIPNVGDIIAKQLISYCGSAEAVFKSNKAKLIKIPGIGEKTAEAIISANVIKQAEKEVERCLKFNIEIIFYSDAGYPEKLRHAPDSPLILYYRGNADLNQNKVISIVGTREATSYGKEFVENFIKGILPHQPLIVSGLAYGIDIIAHRESLKRNLQTVGIVANGLDTLYPAAHKDIAYKMVQCGGVLTEHPLGTKPEAHNFPMRNRIIAGMSDAIIVVEAASSGGALITAEVGNSYNRDVFAVPGNIGNRYSEGCNNLIKANKAHLITSYKDVEYIMNWEADPAEISRSNPQLALDLTDMNPDEKKVLDILKENDQELHIDDISWRTKIPINKIASILLNLEFKSFVKSLPGKKFKIL
jgi:DNA processing protein